MDLPTPDTSLSPSETCTILESFGKNTSEFVCADCGQKRRYYDLLSDRRMLCLECSSKGGFSMDVNVAINVRDPGLMLNDPELVDIRRALVHWELSKGSVPLGEVRIPMALAEEVIHIAKKEKSSLDVLVTTALSMMAQAYKHEEEGTDG